MQWNVRVLKNGYVEMLHVFQEGKLFGVCAEIDISPLGLISLYRITNFNKLNADVKYISTYCKLATTIEAVESWT